MPSLAVTGGKGGTGKSTVAVNLAFALAMKGLNVDLLDLDVECPNDSRIAGIDIEPVSNVYKPIPRITDRCTGCGLCVQSCEPKALYMLNRKANLIPDLCEGCMLCKEVCPFQAIETDKKKVGTVSKGDLKIGDGKVSLIEGRLEIGEDASTRVILEALKHSKSDIRVIDTAAGTHCTVVKALRNADYAFVVTEPTPFGASDSKKIIDVLKKLNLDFDLVVNRSGFGGAKLPAKPRFEIPYSKVLVDSYVSGTPIIVKNPEIREAKIFMEMADYAWSVLSGNKV